MAPDEPSADGMHDVIPVEVRMVGEAEAGPATFVAHHAGYALVVEIDGELDVSNVEALRRFVSDVLPADADAVVVDFARTRYIDSSGLSLVLRLASDVQRRRGAVAVVAPPGSAAQRVFELTGVAQVVPVHPDRASALARTGG